MGVGGVPKSTSRELSGTPYFMAPELWNGGAPSIKTDIFSLGVTFFHCFTQEHPFVEDDASVRIAHEVRLKGLHEFLSTKGGEGTQILKFLKKCLLLDPGQRYQSYDEMLQEHSWLRMFDSTGNWTIERSEVVAGAAQFFRTKRETFKAFNLVERMLGKRPNDIV